ncbi:urease accessory protein UreF [Yinghuangia seranimata]|uniref:urease accessory protein UreF n=1 Tax=Yinghuangia seranimata TaxID=408067 RepID=UPI00248ADA5F|nr:urease accessory UreF family protein [Yinghuangia seranimata]MDI2125168.1 urease accessory UreF family protein [Yinghuangia seranimata]
MGAGLLLLGDSRLPAGGHAHSGGLENAVARGEVHDLDTLTDFLLGRLYGTGAVQAAFAACAALAAGPYALDADGPWGELDTELDARTPSAPARASSRAQGRSLRRVARAAWPEEPWTALGVSPHHAVVLGAAASRARLDARGAAVLAATNTVNGPASAAVKLLSFDPIAVTVVLAEMAGHCDQVADEAAEAASTVMSDGDWDRLPAWSSPGLDMCAELHAREEVVHFAS